MVIFTLQSHVKPLAQKLAESRTQYLVAVRVAVRGVLQTLTVCGVGEGRAERESSGFAMCVPSLSHVYSQCDC